MRIQLHEKPAKPDLNRLQIQDSPTEAALLRRIAGRTALAGVEKRPLPLYPVNPVDTGEKGGVSSPKATDGRHEIISDQDAERRRPQRPVLTESGGRTRERAQPALAAGDQLSGGGPGRDDIATGRTAPTLGAVRSSGWCNNPGSNHVTQHRKLRSAASGAPLYNLKNAPWAPTRTPSRGPSQHLSARRQGPRALSQPT